MRLNDIQIRKEDLVKEISLAGGEIEPYQESLLEDLQTEEQDELEKLAARIQEIREEKAGVEGKIAYLTSQIAHHEKHIHTLEHEEEWRLALAGKAVPKNVPVETLDGTFEWKRTYSTEIDADVVVKELPERFHTYKEEYTPDKRELRRAIEAKEFTHPGIRVKETWRLKLK